MSAFKGQTEKGRRLRIDQGIDLLHHRGTRPQRIVFELALAVALNKGERSCGSAGSTRLSMPEGGDTKPTIPSTSK